MSKNVQLKAKCINAGAHRQWEVGKIYNYTIKYGVCFLEGAMAVSMSIFNSFFEKVKDDETKNL